MLAADEFYYRWKMHEPNQIDFLVWFLYNFKRNTYLNGKFRSNWK